ncbi:hypothetical protein [Azospirillum sp. sgz302134]
MAQALRTLIVAALMVALTLFAGTASAQHALPPIDLFVFLDNSKTVFTGGPDGPNQRLAEMLKTAFNLPIDGTRTFVSQGDRVSLYTFGREVLPLAERIDGGNVSALNNAVNRFTEAITPDRVTDFGPILRSISTLPGLQDRSDNRLKIVLIASDFIHDPSNQAENNRGTGICDLMKQYKATQKTAVASDIDAVRRAIAVPADSDQLPVYVGLFVVRPSEADFAETTKPYRDCALDTVRLRPLVQSLEKELNAQSIEYSDAAKDLNQFAREFVDGVLRATRPRLALSAGACQPRGVDGMSCTLTVRNPARVPTRLRSVALADRPDGAALATIAADRTIEAGATDTIDLRVGGNEARSLLAAASIFAGLDSEGRGAPTRVKVEKGGGGGLTVNEVKAERRAAGQPASLIITLANPQSDARIVRRIAFYSAEPGNAGLGGIDLPASTELAKGGTRSLTIPLTQTIDAALDRGPVFASVLSMDRERLNDPESPRVRVVYGRPAPLRVAEARARTQDGRVFLDIEVVSPGLPPRLVRNVIFYGADGSPFANEPVSSAAEIAAGGSARLTVPLGVSAVQALNNNSLSVAVDDAASGSESQPRLVGRPTASSTSLKIDELRWLENVETGLLRARIVVSNGNAMFRESLTGVMLRGEGGEKVAVQTDPSTLSPGSTMEKILTFDGRDIAVRAILRQSSFFIQAMDDNDNLGPEKKETTPSYVPLRLASGAFAPNDKGFLELQLQVQNPSLVLNRLTQVRIFGKGGRPEQAEPLPLPSPVSIAGLGQETIKIPFNKDFFRAHSPHLDQNVVLQDENGQAAPGRALLPSYPITPLPSKPLKVADSVAWSDRLPLILSVTVENEAIYNQTLGRILLAPPEGGEPEFYDPPNGIEIRGASKEGAKEIPTPLQVVVPMKDEWQTKLLAGQNLRICALTDLDVLQNPKLCPVGWASVALPTPKPLEVQVNKDRPFDPQRREIRIDMANPGIVPNMATGYALLSPDGKKEIAQKTFDIPEFVGGGKTVTKVIALNDNEAREIATLQRFRVELRDKTSSTRNGDARSSSSAVGGIPVFDFAFSNFKATKVPTKDPYTAISVDIEIQNTSFLRLGKQEFNVWLSSKDGTAVYGDRIVIPHDFSGVRESFAVTVAWGLQGDFRQYSPGLVRIAPVSNQENSKSFSFDDSFGYNLSAIIMAGSVVVSAIMLLSIAGLARKWSAVRKKGLVEYFLSNGSSAFDWISSFSNLFGSFIVPSSFFGAWISLLWLLGDLDWTVWLSVIAVVTSAFTGLSLLARGYKRFHVNRIAVKGEKAKEMPAVIHSFDRHVALLILGIFLVSLVPLITYAIWYTPTDPRTVEHHWDYREARNLTTALN